MDDTAKQDNSVVVWNRNDENTGMIVEKIAVEEWIDDQDEVRTRVTVCYYGSCAVFDLKDFVKDRFKDSPKD